MESLRVPVDERLACPGDTFAQDIKLAPECVSLGSHSFTFADGLEVHAVFTNAGQGILLTGMVLGRASSICDRCLEDAVVDVSAELGEFYYFKAPEYPLESEDEEDYCVLGDDKTIDLADGIVSALVLELPFVVLCSEDCKGLCPVCGANLNTEDCGHTALIKAAQEAAAKNNNPFAALAELDLSDAGDADGD